MRQSDDRSAKAGSLLSRTGYQGSRDALTAKLDTARPTVGPIAQPHPLERARGGAAKHSKVNVNVIVPPSGGAPGGGHPLMPGPGGPAMPPRPPIGGMPPGGPPGGPPGMPPPGGSGGGPPIGGMRPPGMKRGGNIAKEMKAGAASGPGRSQKTKAYGERDK